MLQFSSKRDLGSILFPILSAVRGFTVYGKPVYGKSVYGGTVYGKARRNKY